METIQAFKASDGSVYLTQEACKEHEYALEWDGRIDKFIASDLCPYKAGPQLAIVKRSIVAWEKYGEKAKEAPAK